MATEEEIKKLAYAIWEEEGRPEGKDKEHYFRARQILGQTPTRLLKPAALLPAFPAMLTIPAYCLKCHARRNIKNPRQVEMKNGRAAWQGTCPVCGSKMFRIHKA